MTHPEYASSAEDFYEHFTPERKEPNMDKRKELDWTKPVRWIHSERPADILAEFTWDGQTIRIISQGDYWVSVNEKGNTSGMMQPCVENAPEPEPPRTFDLAKAVRMTMGAMSGQLPFSTAVAGYANGKQVVAVFPLSDGSILAIDREACCNHFPASGSWSEEPFVTNSHLPEPQGKKIWIFVTNDGHIATRDTEQTADSLLAHYTRLGNLYGSAKVTIYKGATI